MNLRKKEDEDFTTFAGLGIDQCEEFKLAELSVDNFKCQIFMQGFVLTKDTEMNPI